MVEVPNNSGTPMQRDKLGEMVKEFDAILKPNGTIIYLGTPQNEASLYNTLLERGYTTRIWTVLYPRDKEERDLYGDKLSPFIASRYDNDPEVYKGKPTDPRRFTMEIIEERMLSYGKAGFLLQFMLNTSLSDAEKYPLKLSDLIVTDLDKNETSNKWSWSNSPSLRLNELPCVGLKGDYYYSEFTRSEMVLPYTGTVMSIDPSGRGADMTAYAIVKYLNGFLFVMEVGGYKDGYSDSTTQMLALRAKFWGVNEVVVEANFGDGMYTKLIEPVFARVHPCAITEIKNNIQKEQRIIDTLEPVMMSHKLIVNKTIITKDFSVFENNNKFSLFYQLTRISKERGSLAHDDLLDALAMAVAYWVDYMSVDVDKASEEFTRKQLEEWMVGNGVLGKYQDRYNSGRGPCVSTLRPFR